MKVLMINSVCGLKSTGRICTDLACELIKHGHEAKIAYGREYVPDKYKDISYRIGNTSEIYKHVIISRLFDKHGYGSFEGTQKLIEYIKWFDPDIVHLHNIHGYYINIGLLFDYLKSTTKQVVWTLHDCWAFTGHCCYFDYANCNKWKTGCRGICVNQKEYPTSVLFSHNQANFIYKRNLFMNNKNMTIVTPSYWLSSLVRESFLSSYDVKVIKNGVDTNIFTYSPSDLKIRLGCENKKIILGVSANWDVQKGLDSFIELSKRLDNNFRIIMIGLTKKQISHLPYNIIGIEKTDNIEQLAEYYSLADCLFNPTLEDNYPTINLEAISCGTPVVTYNTGGSPECILNDKFGCIINKYDYDSVINYCSKTERISSQESVVFDKKNMLDSYIKLYNNILS